MLTMTWFDANSKPILEKKMIVKLLLLYYAGVAANILFARLTRKPFVKYLQADFFQRIEC